MALTSVTIEWYSTTLAALCLDDDCYWYAVSGPKDELLYIGMTYRQTSKKRMTNTGHIRDKYGDLKGGVTIWIGKLAYSSQKRVTYQLVESVEGLLIYLNQPSQNGPFKVSYTRRDNLVIRSRGGLCLLKEVRIEDGRFRPQTNLPAEHGKGCYNPRLDGSGRPRQ